MPATASSRLFPKSYTIAQPSDDPLTQARAAVADALILQPKIRGVDLAEAMLNNSFEFQADLNEILARNFYLSAYHAAKKLQSAAARAQLVLPGFEHLPLKVPGLKGKRISLLDANLFRVRDYYRSLVTGHDARKKSDPRVIEAKALMEKLRKRSRKEKGITVRQVLLLEE